MLISVIANALIKEVLLKFYNLLKLVFCLAKFKRLIENDQVLFSNIL